MNAEGEAAVAAMAGDGVDSEAHLWKSSVMHANSMATMPGNAQATQFPNRNQYPNKSATH